MSRRSELLSSLVIMALVGGLFVAIINGEENRADEYNLHDSGVWVTGEADRSVGRVNTEAARIDAHLPGIAAQQREAESGMDLWQSDSSVYLALSNGERGRVITEIDTQNPSALAIDSARSLAPDAQIGLGGSRSAVLSDGNLWVGDAALPLRIDTTADEFSTPPAASDLAGDAQLAVSPEGVTAVLDDDRIVVFNKAGEKREQEVSGVGGEDITMTLIGETSVLLDRGEQLLWISGKRFDIDEVGEGATLQHPGPSATRVIVGSSKGLFAVALDDGTTTRLWADRDMAGAVAPVTVGACAWGAWEGTRQVVRYCDGTGAEPLKGRFERPKDEAKPSPLEFRVNRSRVVLNEIFTGRTAFFADDQLVVLESLEIDEPTECKPEDKKGECKNPQDGGSDRKECKADSPPVATNDPEDGEKLQARPGQSLVVDVLVNDTNPNPECFVLTVTELRIKPELGSVQIIDGGLAVQYSPPPGDLPGAIVEFTYKASDGIRVSDGAATVRITILDDETNGPGISGADTLTVGAGETNSKNVLENDRDAEGDPMRLLQVGKAPSAIGFPADLDDRVQWRPDGTVTVDASELGGGQSYELKYLVRDVPPGSITPVDTLGDLTITVEEENSEPTPKGDVATAAVDETVTIDVLANDSDPDGDELSVDERLVIPDRGVLTASVDAAGMVTASASVAGEHYFEYVVTDGDLRKAAIVRLTVAARENNEAPVAVDDIIVLDDKGAGSADLVANDFDADGDVVMVNDVPALLEPPSGLTVALVGHASLRVEVNGDDVKDQYVLTYRITDGQRHEAGTAEFSTGRVIVVARTESGNQVPTLNRDSASVRVGNVAVVDLVANDVDPENDPLTVIALTDEDGEPVDGTVAGLGTAFVRNNKLHFRPSSSAPNRVVLRYRVVDLGNNRPTQRVFIDVLREAQNTKPIAPRIVARVIADQEISIAIPLIGVDPDGDTVTLVGLGERVPALGFVQSIDKQVIQYRALRDVSGTDTFEYRITDGVDTVTGEIRVGVLPVPDRSRPPVAIDDVFPVIAGETARLRVLDNDSDPDGTPLTIVKRQRDAGSSTVPNAPEGSEFAVVEVERDGKEVLRYEVPATASAGTPIYFSYKIQSGGLRSEWATVTLEIISDLAAPIALDDVTGPQDPDTEVPVDVLKNDIVRVGSAADLEVSLAPEIAQEFLARVEGQTVVVPVTTRPVTIPYSIKMPGDSPAAHAFIVIPIRDAELPRANTDEASAEASAANPAPVPIDVLKNDTPSGKVSLVGVLGDGRCTAGTVAADSSNGTVTYTPTPKEKGLAVCYYLVADDQNRTDTGIIRIDVQGDNTQPYPTDPLIVLDVPAATQFPVTYPLGDFFEDEDEGDTLSFSLADDSGVDTSVVSLDFDKSAGTVTLEAADDAPLGTCCQFTIDVDDGGFNGPLEGVGITIRVIETDAEPTVARPDPETDQPINLHAGETSRTYPVLENDVDGLDLKNPNLMIDAVAAPAGIATISADKQMIEVNISERFEAADLYGEVVIRYTIIDAQQRRSTADLTILVIHSPLQPGVVDWDRNAPIEGDELGVLNVTWGRPRARGADIAYFELSVFDASGRTVSIDPSEFDVEFGEVSLTVGDEYTFEVVAVAISGQVELRSESSDRSDPRIINAQPSPVEPGSGPSGVAVQWGDGNAEVFWNEVDPERNDKITGIYGYRIDAYAPGSDPTTTGALHSEEVRNPARTSGVIPLANGGDYEIYVTVLNTTIGDADADADESERGYIGLATPRSAPKSAVPAPVSVTPESLGAAAENLSVGRLIVEWEPYNDNNPGAEDEIWYELVRRNSSGEETRVERVESPYPDPTTLNTDEYQYRVIVHNRVTDCSDPASSDQCAWIPQVLPGGELDSAWSAVANSLGVPNGTPGPVQIVSEREDRAVKLSWGACDEQCLNGADLQYYEVSNGSRTDQVSALTHTFGGLQNGIDYTFNVVAVTNGGVGGALARSAAPSPPAVARPYWQPLTPTLSGSTSGSVASFSWSCNNPCLNGRPQSNYRFRVNGGAQSGNSWSGDVGYNTTVSATVEVETLWGWSPLASSSVRTDPPPPPPYRDLTVVGGSTCPEPEFIVPDHFDPGPPATCSAPNGWIANGATVRVVCYTTAPAGFAVDGNRRWWRKSGGTYDGWWVADASLSGDKSGLGQC